MEGFDSGNEPVFIKLDPEVGYGTDPIPVNGLMARFAGTGLIVDVDGVRHWVPQARIREMYQQQPVSVTPPDPAGP